MDIRQAIASRVELLPEDLQERVLRFVASLSASPTIGENGSALRQFSYSIDSASARQMMEAIEEECERVDVGEW